MKKIIIIFLIYLIQPFLLFGQLNSDSLFLIKKNEKWGYINALGNINIIPIYEYAKEFSEGLAVIEKNSKSGYINNVGEIVIDLKYDIANDFSEGLALVSSSDNKEYIDKKGNRAFTLPIGTDEALSFSNELAAFLKEDLWGYINKKGQIVIEPKFYYTESVDYNFSQGFVNLVTYDSLTNEFRGSYYGKDGNSKFKYDGYNFLDSLARIYFNDKDGFIDLNGNIVIEPKFDGVVKINGDMRGGFSQGMACVKYNGKWGVINKKGNFIIPPQFEEILTPFQEGLAAIKVKDKIGFIDSTGKIVIACEYDALSLNEPNHISMGFNNGLCLVVKNGMWGYINKNGIYVWSSN